MEQRTDEWYQARLGKLTASRFNDIVKLDGTLKTGETPKNYMDEKIYELLNDKPINIEANKAMQWGTDTEDEARLAYEDSTFEIVQEVGFVVHPTYDFIGCSSDGLVGGNGGIEIKCPYNPTNHIRTIIDNECPSRYKAQVQGNIWINQLEWMDFVSFDPRMAQEERQIKIIRCYLDTKYVGNLEVSLSSFWEQTLYKLSQIPGSPYQLGTE